MGTCILITRQAGRSGHDSCLVPGVTSLPEFDIVFEVLEGGLDGSYSRLAASRNREDLRHQGL